MDVTVLLIRGVVGVVAGILAILWPGLTITFLVALFGLYAFVDGITNVINGLRKTPEGDRRWWTFVQGLIGIAAGVLVFMFPGPAALALVFWIGAWAIVTGALEVAAAIRLRREIRGEWLLALAGVLSIVLGVVLFAFPLLGLFGLAIALGAYAAASGIVLIALAVRLRTRLAV